MKKEHKILSTYFLIKLTGLFILALITVQAGAKSKSRPMGKFSKYTQVCDKEILVESTRGVKVLFKAIDNERISVSYFDADEPVRLSSPAEISIQNKLHGSIYVEELDELMQITTTTEKGLKIKLDRKNFEFTLVDTKSNTSLTINEEMIEHSNILARPQALIVQNSEANLVNVHPTL